MKTLIQNKLTNQNIITELQGIRSLSQMLNDRAARLEKKLEAVSTASNSRKGIKNQLQSDQRLARRRKTILKNQKP